MAAIFLKEKITSIHRICLILTISGVLLIIQPTFLRIEITTLNVTEQTNSTNSNFTNNIGITLGLVSALAVSCVAILIKKLSDLNVHYSINVIFSSYIGFPSALIISLVMYLTHVRNVDSVVYDTPEKLMWQIIYSLSSALCGCIYQLLIAVSNKYEFTFNFKVSFFLIYSKEVDFLKFRYEDANKLAIISTTSLFWSFLLQYYFLGIASNIYATLGALLISLSAILNIFIKIFDQSRKRKSDIRI